MDLNTTLTSIGVGIDTARYGHHVSFVRDDKQPAARPLEITESREGYDQLQQRLLELHAKYPDATFRVHLDAAGQYASNLERFLRTVPIPSVISIGEPKRNKDYHKAVSPKRTSDATESYAMGRFGAVEKPSATHPIPDEFYALREIVSRLQGAVKDCTRAINRAHNVLARVFPELATIVEDISTASILTLLDKYPTPQRIAAAHLESIQKIPYLRDEKATAIRQAAKESVGTLQGQIAESLIRQSVDQIQTCLRARKEWEDLLLQAYRALRGTGHVQVSTIPGIGEITAAVLVAKIISIDRFATPEHLVGYFGIFPEENTSGYNRDGKPVSKGTMQMSAKGSDIVRRYLWNAAKNAIGTNPAVRSLYARLRAKGTRGDVAMGHCMRKLLHLVFAVWATDTPFNEAHYPWERSAPGETNAAAQDVLGAEEMTKPANTPPVTEATPPPVATEPAPEMVTPATNPDKRKEAAGHKRETSPQTKVVTATNPSVEPSTRTVNHHRPKHGTIDFAFIREQVTIRQALEHLGYLHRLRAERGELRGPCPIHSSENSKSRSFAANLDKNVFSCHNAACGQAGNVIDFWAAVHKLPIYEAACHLADVFHIPTTRTQPTEKRSP
jgi:transposase